MGEGWEGGHIQLIMIVVTCAVIRNEENEVLVVQRGEFTDHKGQGTGKGVYGKLGKACKTFGEVLREKINEVFQRGTMVQYPR